MAYNNVNALQILNTAAVICCGLLINISETLKVLFAKSEAIACIIDAMKQFQDKEELQLNACRSLLKMASASGLCLSVFNIFVSYLSVLTVHV